MVKILSVLTLLCFPMLGFSESDKGWESEASEKFMSMKEKPIRAFRVPKLGEEGSFYTENSFKGKYVLIDFWGPWCGYCVEELPNLASAHKKFSSRGLEIFSICHDMQEEPSEIETYVENHDPKLSWHHGIVPYFSKKYPIIKDFGIYEYPSMILLSPEGVVISLSPDKLTGEALHETLDEVLPGLK